MPTKNEAQPIDRIFAILDAVIAARKPVSLAEIAVLSGMPPPTVHRLIGNLEERGLLKRALGSAKLLLPGPRLVQMGRDTLEGALIADEPHNILEQLASEVEEYCQLGTIQQGEVLYLDTVKARRSSGLQLEQGRSAPLHATSMGKLYLASMEESVLIQWLETRTLEKLTPMTMTDPKHLLKEIRQIRERAWATANEEYGIGIVGCAVAVPMNARATVFYLGISAPTARVPFDTLERFIAPLRRAAQRIAAAT